MDILKVSTAVTIVMGPMLDSTDGNTQETGLTIAQADIRLSKNGGAYAQTNNVAGATHMEVGNYSVPLDTTDTGTLGKVRVSIHESGALAIWREFTIVPANVYDSLVLGTDVITADVTQWLGTAAATPTVAGVPEVDVTHWLGSTVVNPTHSGVPEISTMYWKGGSIPTPSVVGVPEVDATHWLGTSVTANIAGQPTVDVTRLGAQTAPLIDLVDFASNGYDSTNNVVFSDLVYIHGSALTETAGQLAAGFTKLFDVATPLLVASDVMRGTDSAALASVCTEARLAELDAANLPTDIADIPTVAEFEARSIAAADYVVTTDTIAGVTTATNLTNAPTNGDLTATMKTSVNTETKDVLTVDTIADSYATDGNQPTIAQAILAIQQMMQDKSISGTTLTVKKPDGSTTAMTFTLDSATVPTSITRAT